MVIFSNLSAADIVDAGNIFRIVLPNVCTESRAGSLYLHRRVVGLVLLHRVLQLLCDWSAFLQPFSDCFVIL